LLSDELCHFIFVNFGNIGTMKSLFTVSQDVTTEADIYENKDRSNSINGCSNSCWYNCIM